MQEPILHTHPVDKKKRVGTHPRPPHQRWGPKVGNTANYRPHGRQNVKIKTVSDTIPQLTI